MGYEGGKPPEPSSDNRFANLDEAIEHYKAADEQAKNKRVEEDNRYPDPKIIGEDIDTLTLQLEGALYPVTFALHFDTDEEHTAFLKSEMTEIALSDNHGAIRRLLSHDEYEEWYAEMKQQGKSTGDETARDATRFEPKYSEDLMKVIKKYGVSLDRIDHARDFAKRHILNAHRARAGKPLLVRETLSYKYNFPSLAHDKPSTSKIIEETRNDPAPQKSWLDAERPQF